MTSLEDAARLVLDGAESHFGPSWRKWAAHPAASSSTQALGAALLALEKAVLEETDTALRPRVLSTAEPDWTDRARGAGVARVAQGGPEELRPTRRPRRPRTLGRVAATLTKIRGRCRV